MALALSVNPEKFKASKGWTDKFAKGFNLRKKMIKKLQSRGMYMHYKFSSKDGDDNSF
jgi:hypothetical protein